MTFDGNVTDTDDQVRAPGPASGLVAALTSEHHDIDAGIEAFVAHLDTPAHDGGGLRAAPLLTAMQALRRHIHLEEVFLFPSIQDAGMAMPVLVMLREHGQLWRAMDDLHELLADPSTDRGDPASRAQVLARCRELLALLDRHNSKEEPIIYSHAGSALADDASAELAAFLESGRTPDGWTCQQAAT